MSSSEKKKWKLWQFFAISYLLPLALFSFFRLIAWSKWFCQSALSLVWFDSGVEQNSLERETSLKTALFFGLQQSQSFTDRRLMMTNSKSFVHTLEFFLGNEWTYQKRELSQQQAHRAETDIWYP